MISFSGVFLIIADLHFFQLEHFLATVAFGLGEITSRRDSLFIVGEVLIVFEDAADKPLFEAMKEVGVLGVAAGNPLVKGTQKGSSLSSSC